MRTIHKLALPDRFLAATADDARDMASEQTFRTDTAATRVQMVPKGRRAGLRTALRPRAHHVHGSAEGLVGPAVT